MIPMPIEIRNLGATVGRTELDSNLIQELLEHSENLHKRANETLAGKIEDEKHYEEESRIYFEKKLIPYAANFYDECKKDKGQLFPSKHLHMAQWKLKSLWVNRQKPGEYNPPHEHAGNISFVIYLQIPPGLYDEIDHATSAPPGYITFRYGSDTGMMPYAEAGKPSERYILSELEAPLRPTVRFCAGPRVGEMWIFPSFLTHHVESFNSPGTRVSVSGNFSLELKN